MRWAHTWRVEVFASRQFQIRVNDLRERARGGDEHAEVTVRLIAAELAVLRALPCVPEMETPELKAVRQSRRYQVWRLSHRFKPGYAVRTIVWFTPSGQAVVALFAGDKAQMGDLFYDTVGQRADQIIDEWLRDRAGEKREGGHQ